MPNQHSFGSGYRLELCLVSNTERTKDLALAFVRRYIHENATIVLHKPNTITINLPQEVNITIMHDDSAPMWREKLDRRLVYGI